MKTEEAISKRKSVRDFSNKPVKFGEILEAIDSANHAPFAGNINNLKYLIIETKENKKYVAEFSQQYWISDAQWIVLICSEPAKLEQLYGERGLNYNKQHVGAAIENMLLRLTDIGLAACWVGAFADQEIKNHFKIPDKWFVEALIPIGHPKKQVKKSPARKVALEGKLFWEKWDQGSKPKKYPFADPSTL